MAHFSTLSVLFPGVNQYVTMGNVLGFDAINTFSISCWFKTSSPVNSFLVSKIDSLNGVGYGLSINAGELQFQLLSIGATGAIIRTIGSNYDDGNWHHACCTHAGAPVAASMAIYVDGYQYPTTIITDTFGPTALNGNPFNLAAIDNGLGGLFFPGNLDEVSIYNAALPLAAIRDIWSSGEPTDISLLPSIVNCLAWWRMGEGDIFPTLADSIGPFPGTMTNMVPGDIVADAATTSYDGSARGGLLENFASGTSNPIDIVGDLKDGGPAGCRWEGVIGNASLNVIMQAVDNITGDVYYWPEPVPEFSGKNYPGPNVPVEISIRSRKGFP
jgi:hypothetical protein